MAPLNQYNKLQIVDHVNCFHWLCEVNKTSFGLPVFCVLVIYFYTYE